MGVYIFSWSKMRKYLELDEANPNSSNDFGKNIIPAMLEAGENLYTYTFDGYWKDVGTIESLWEANMDLLEMPMPIDLYDKRWRIYARNPGMPPHYIADGAKVVNCLITEGCEVKGVINHSVLFAGVTVETGRGNHRRGYHAGRGHRARCGGSPRHCRRKRAHLRGRGGRRGDRQDRRDRPQRRDPCGR